MFDVVVLGLGGVGSFALRAVAKETRAAAGTSSSFSVLGIEQFTRGHQKGSSHGKSRVYRRAYFEHPNYVPWINFSVEEFTKLQEQQKVSILNECGVLLMVPKGDTNLLDKALASAKEHNITTEELDSKELEQRFPQFNYKHEMAGVYEPAAGLVRPELAIHAALTDAEENGATIWEQTNVLSLNEIRNERGEVSHVELVVQRQSNEKEIIQARKILVAAGAWTSKLIPSYAPHLKVIRQLYTWVDVSNVENPLVYESSHMPAFAVIIPDLLPTNEVYGLPADEKTQVKDKYSTCVKLGIFGRDVPIDPDENHRADVTRSEEAEMEEAILAVFNAQLRSQPPTDTNACMFTMTEDGHFIVGVPNGYTRICAIAGLSGHGFKMTPALGQMLADFALDKDWKSWNADFCSPSRFGI